MWNQRSVDYSKLEETNIITISQDSFRLARFAFGKNILNDPWQTISSQLSGIRDGTWADQNSWCVQTELRFPFDFKSNKEGRDGFTAVYLNWSIYIHLNLLSVQSLCIRISGKMLVFCTWKTTVNFKPEDLLFSSCWLKKCGGDVWPPLLLGWASHCLVGRAVTEEKVPEGSTGGSAGEAGRGQIQGKAGKSLRLSMLSLPWNCVEESQMRAMLLQQGYPTAVTMDKESQEGGGLWWTFPF